MSLEMISKFCIGLVRKGNSHETIMAVPMRDALSVRCKAEEYVNSGVYKVVTIYRMNEVRKWD